MSEKDKINQKNKDHEHLCAWSLFGMLGMSLF